MKKFTIFESAIIGLFVGVIFATYLVYVVSMDSFRGAALSWLVLLPLYAKLGIVYSQSLTQIFFGTVLVFTVYGAIFGVIGFLGKKVMITLITLAVLAFLFTAFEQVTNSSNIVAADNGTLVAAVYRSRASEPNQYFGSLESRGDLNSDGREDIAFIASREDQERGSLFYVMASLATDAGHTGTNMVFMGDKVKPVSMVVSNNKIIVTYSDLKDKKASTTNEYFYEIISGVLIKSDTSTTTNQ